MHDVDVKSTLRKFYKTLSSLKACATKNSNETGTYADRQGWVRDALCGRAVALPPGESSPSWVLVALSRDGPSSSPSLRANNRSTFFGWLPGTQKAEARCFLPLLMCLVSTSKPGSDTRVRHAGALVGSAVNAG